MLHIDERPVGRPERLGALQAVIPASRAADDRVETYSLHVVGKVVVRAVGSARVFKLMRIALVCEVHLVVCHRCNLHVARSVALVPELVYVVASHQIGPRWFVVMDAKPQIAPLVNVIILDRLTVLKILGNPL